LTSTMPKVACDLSEPCPTYDQLPRRFSDFDSLVEALEYAAQGVRGINFYSARGELKQSVSYHDLCEWAKRIGSKLIALGFAPGERLALIAATQADFVAVFFGCQYAGVLPVPLPLPTSFGGRESYVTQLRRQMESCRASGVVGPAGMAELTAEGADGLNLKFEGSFDALEAEATPKGVELYRPASGDLAYLQYSSGSTRFPHGIAITHRSLLANCGGQGGPAMKLQADDRTASWLPFYHDMGLVGMLLTPLTNQVSVDYLATEDFARRPLEWLKLLSCNRGTISYAPTFGYDICARRIGEDLARELDLSPWRVAGIGGDMIRPDVLRSFVDKLAPAGFRETAFVPSYGLAECTLAVSITPVGRGIEVDLVDERVLAGTDGSRVEVEARRSLNGTRLEGAAGVERRAGEDDGTRRREVVNCGLPLPGYEVEIRNEDGCVLEDWRIGRIFVRGPSVMRGYFHDAEATASVLSGDGWLDTGDMGYMREGFLYVVGRAKDMIIVNGRNHWPQDIEWAVEQLPGMRSGDVAAVSLPGEGGEEIATVLVHCRLSDAAARKDFAEQVRRQVRAVTGVQCRIALVPPRSLPRTSSGKLSRSKTRQQVLSGSLSVATF